MRNLSNPRPSQRLLTPIVLSFLLGLIAIADVPAATAPCRIEVVEKGTGWPVPLVQLRTTHQTSFVTDNAGIIALDAPELLDREVWFDVIGHGYEVKADGFGMRGVRITPQSGKSIRIEVSRTIIAKRLGRATGAGLFAESQKLGLEKDWNETGIFGCDTVQNAVYQGKLFWAWGDTMLPNYPLGIYDMTGATTALQPLDRFEPPLRLRFDHFKDSAGRPRGIAKMPGQGPTWAGGFVTLPDKTGTPRLCATYSKIRGHLEAYEIGLCVWNDVSSCLELLRVLWTKSEKHPTAPPFPDGHPVLWKDAQGKEWALFGNPLPNLRCPAMFESWQDATKWESIKPQADLAAAGESKKRVKPHSGSIAYNAFRKRWVTVFMENFGKPSVFGELWYAEAPAPTGPWGTTVKILTHDNYTFYNPRIHPEFTKDGSPILIFEGTYTQEFANHAVATPRYNYNQILYRLDLDDPALKPARTE